MRSFRFQEKTPRLEDFEAAALPHLDSLFRTALRLIGNQADAQDLVQEVYLHAWQSFHRFELGTNCKAWLFKIMFHRLQHCRRRWARLPAVGADEIMESLRQQPPVADTLEDKEVLAALEKLAVPFREVLLLADVEELSYKEIAATLGIRIGTVMSRLSRARKMLRAELGPVAASIGIGPARPRECQPAQ